ncbi:MAG: N-6 DNA methylase, partial [Candidatus Competibacteraceae bacterium]
MNALQAIEQELKQTGYPPDAVIRDYSFADVLAPTSQQRTTRLAAFTHTPPSYRSAALGVVDLETRDPSEVVAKYRALGAPLLFLLQDNVVTVWQVRQSAQLRQICHATTAELPNLFDAHREEWKPQAIHRAKLLGELDRTYQLDFVDVGLLPAIEAEIHSKLDRMLSDMLSEAYTLAERERLAVLDDRALFRVTFRLLAAKVLQDREHEIAKQWTTNNVGSAVEVISNYYGLHELNIKRSSKALAVVARMWEQLCQGINFRNISTDDLAFVYENTLVTPDTRKKFGTHSTPRQIAEYVVSRLDLRSHDPADLRIYEPFAGSGVFLVSALRHIKDLLPLEWDHQKRHDFLTERLVGDELDAFACEVASLSLILADYPTANGWNINEIDLFKDDRIAKRAKGFNVILCNPPFQAFNPQGQRDYPKAAARSHTKAASVLNAVLDATPQTIGFVLPHPFIFGPQYESERRRIEALYQNIEIVSVPDRTFKASSVESALLIAQEPRAKKSAKMTSLRSSHIADRDREKFLSAGQVTSNRSLVRPYSEERVGDLWISELHDLWERLEEGYAHLSDFVSIHNGVQWNYLQSDAVSLTSKPGYALGLHNAKSIRQFLTGAPVWLDCRPENLRRAASLPWSSPKIVTNAGCLSRGSWRIATAVDTQGLVCSQQFFGLWPNKDKHIDLHVLCAVLNSPVANAYLAEHSPIDRIRVVTLNNLPIPKVFPQQLSPYVQTYSALISEREALIYPQKQQAAQEILNQIDALVLKAYDLPPRLEKALLEFFRGSKRPVVHPWHHWLPEGFNPCIPLHEYFSPDYEKLTGNWV